MRARAVWDVTDEDLSRALHFGTSETLDKQIEYDYHDPDPVCPVI